MLKMASGENMGAEQAMRPKPSQNAPQAENSSPAPEFLKTSQPENTYNQEIDKKALPTQSQEIRANVALKMVSEIIASGQIGLEEWKKYADEFYNYKP